MTNVPSTIRNAWADAYKLFDISYGMDGREEAWKKYWDTANELTKKYGDEIPMLEMFEAIAHMIEHFVKQREKPKNESLLWQANEPYPYPRE